MTTTIEHDADVDVPSEIAEEMADAVMRRDVDLALSRIRDKRRGDAVRLLHHSVGRQADILGVFPLGKSQWDIPVDQPLPSERLPAVPETTGDVVSVVDTIHPRRRFRRYRGQRRIGQ